MNNSAKHIEHLWKQYLTGQSTPEELEEFLALEHDDDHKALVENLLTAHPEHRRISMEKRQALLQTIIGKRVVPMRRWWWAAASILVIAISAIILWNVNSPKPAIPTATINIPAGKNGAILTLADGSRMVLDSMGNGQIADRITLNNGQLFYDSSQANSPVAAYNTMSTPKGRQFTLRLADGTQVWLNSESSIRYPVVFTGKERTVEINGEAYFEVAHDAAHPFKVAVNGKNLIEVLGTEFNVNAYRNEESIKTTLVHGSVRIHSSVVLKPGQQAILTADTTITTDADLEKVTAWKNGGFDFENVSLSEAMRQLERWYDIKVVMEPGVPRDAPFYGQVSRDISLQDLLKLFEKSNLKFRIENERTLIIYK